jgi:uncharacterized protein (TIGR04141 family)
MAKRQHHSQERNKLSIYLIKDTVNQFGAMLDPKVNNVSYKVIPGIGRLYYRNSDPQPPDWVRSFFLDNQVLQDVRLTVSSASALLLVKVPYRKTVRYFAIPFGAGRHLLKDSCYVGRFGLRTALNLMSAEGVKHLDKRNLNINPKISREQIAKAGTVSEFEFDFDRDMVQAITGEVRNSQYGKVVTGKDALAVNLHVDLTNLVAMLERCLDTYSRSDYQKNFKWVDQLQDIRDQDVVNRLNEQLLHEINNLSDAVSLAIPEIIDWPEVAGFKYSQRKRDQLVDELRVRDMISSEDLSNGFIAKDLTENYITCWNADNRLLHRWSMFRCINAEIDMKGHKYILSDGKWYEIERNYVAEVNAFVNSISRNPNPLPIYNHANENAYNEAVAQAMNAICLDGRNMVHGGGRSKIEFCDILAPDRILYHIKIYGGSSVLSHLFNQGLNSATLLAEDTKFREKLRDIILPRGFKTLVPRNQIDPRNYKIVYGIIGQPGNGASVNIPFFSKISLRSTVKSLQRFGYDVYLDFISQQ